MLNNSLIIFAKELQKLAKQLQNPTDLAITAKFIKILHTSVMSNKTKDCLLFHNLT